MPGEAQVGKWENFSEGEVMQWYRLCREVGGSLTLEVIKNVEMGH